MDTTRHNASTCRWAVPTLFLAYPVWLEAASRPWTCVRDEEPRPLWLTRECEGCSRWEPDAVKVTLDRTDGVTM